MPNRVYKHIDVTGASADSSDDAVRAALRKAGESVRGMRWFKVKEIRGTISGDAVEYWQVTIEVGFAVE